MEIMNLSEKRDYIVNRLLNDDSIIDHFYEALQKNDALKEKLQSRAKKSEEEIKSGKVFTREDIEQKTNHIGR